MGTSYDCGPGTFKMQPPTEGRIAAFNAAVYDKAVDGEAVRAGFYRQARIALDMPEGIETEDLLYPVCHRVVMDFLALSMPIPGSALERSNERAEAASATPAEASPDSGDS